MIARNNKSDGSLRWLCCWHVQIAEKQVRQVVSISREGTEEIAPAPVLETLRGFAAAEIHVGKVRGERLDKTFAGLS